MTREEAIFILQNIDRRVCDDELSEALDVAIEALSEIDDIKAEINQLPSYVARFNGGDFAIHIDKEGVLQIINKRISGKESE